MMLEQNLVDSNKKKKKKILLILTGLIFLIIILSTFSWIIKEQNCLEFRESFSIENACNLNENEVEVSLKRSSDNINLKIIKFKFQPSKSLWKVDGTKCLDIKLKENRYGNYCELIKDEESSTYVFNLSLGKQNNIKVWIGGNKKICKIGEREITEC